MHKDNLLIKLNEEQRKAVLHKSGPMLVTAGPGSGKTHVIISRLIMMIHEYKIPPEKILVITYTKEAAGSMRSRFLKQISEEWKVSFHTFHSFYFQIIKTIPQYSDYRLIKEQEKKYILSKVINVSDVDAKEMLIEELLQTLSFYKNTERVNISSKNKYLAEDNFKYYFQKYEEEKRKRKLLDFDDMLYLCLKILQNNPMILDKWRKRFEYYLVDEFQDSNPVQYKILKMLASDNLFVVGDDDQAIYGFRGADAGIMSEFQKDYPQCEKVVLGVNYRSGSGIVDACSKMISENQNRIPKCLTAHKTELPYKSVCIRGWKEKKDIFEYLHHIFNELSKDELSQYAILFRTNQEMQVYGAMLHKWDIPFVMKEKFISVYDHFIIKDLCSVLYIVQGKLERKHFLHILGKLLNHVKREAFENELVNYNELKSFYRNKYMYDPETVSEVEAFQKSIEIMSKMSLKLQIRYLRKALKYDQYLMKKAEYDRETFYEYVEKLDWIERDADQFDTFADWLKYQKDYEMKVRNEVEQYQRSNEENNYNGVNLMTMHASKGLEFDHVYIMNVNEGAIPRYQKGEKLNQERLEEERRIFYVGMTRAKKTLELHYLTGTKERPKYPSRFIKNLICRED